MLKKKFSTAQEEGPMWQWSKPSSMGLAATWLWGLLTCLCMRPHNRSSESFDLILFWKQTRQVHWEAIGERHALAPYDWLSSVALSANLLYPFIATWYDDLWKGLCCWERACVESLYWLIQVSVICKAERGSLPNLLMALWCFSWRFTAYVKSSVF